MRLKEFRAQVKHDLEGLHQKIKKMDNPQERAEALRKYSRLWRALKKY